MDLFSGLQSLLGGELSSAKPKGEQKSGSSTREGVELQKKNSRLKEQLDAAHKRIAELEKQIDHLKEESGKVEQNLDRQREDIDQLITGVTIQIQDMIDTLNQQMQQLDFKAQRQMAEHQGTSGQIENITESTQQIADSTQQIDEIKAMIETLEQQKVSLDEINEKSDSMKEEIFEKIHMENVACYRNMKSLVTELHENVNDMELGEDSLMEIRSSFKGMKTLSVFSLLSFIVALILLLVVLRVIPL